MTANAITSVSLDPILLLVCINRQARMCHLITEAQRFAINILCAHGNLFPDTSPVAHRIL